MTKSFPKIEDIVEGLSIDLDQRGFSRVNPEENKVLSEVVRYKKEDSPIGFKVGMAQDYQNPQVLDINTIFLVLNYNLSEDISQSAEHMIPNPELMRLFFRNSPIYNIGLANDKDSLQKEKIKLYFYIEFEKDKTTAIKMRTVIRETVDYICNYVTTNANMLTRTQSFDFDN